MIISVEEEHLFFILCGTVTTSIDKDDMWFLFYVCELCRKLQNLFMCRF